MITGPKITGASRNTRKVYGDLPGDLPGPIIYRVFRETGPWYETLLSQAFLTEMNKEAGKK